MWVDSGNGIYFQMWTKQKKEQKCWRVQWQNWEGRHLKSCQMMRSVFFAFLFGLAVAAIRILTQFVEAIWLWQDRKSTRLNSSHSSISYAVFCLKKKINKVIYKSNAKK